MMVLTEESLDPKVVARQNLHSCLQQRHRQVLALVVANRLCRLLQQVVDHQSNGGLPLLVRFYDSHPVHRVGMCRDRALNTRLVNLSVLDDLQRMPEQGRLRCILDFLVQLVLDLRLARLVE